ncbi:MAG: hypothetical protein APF76_03635 [Desulfitibacter sp. BRH_c19]|nr:MAG: hypothetical protein APF76_03635 [Desulfitibacter sp. BRH_c19]
MDYQVLTNLKIVVPSILTIILFGLVVNWGIGKLFNELELISNKIAQKIVPWLSKFRLSIIILEFAFLAFSILFLIVMCKAKYWAFIPYVIYSFINSAILITLRKQTPKQASFFDLAGIRNKKFHNENYFFSRLGYFGKNGFSLIILLVLIQIIFRFLLLLEWPISVYYIAYIVFPLYVNFWIYFDKLKFNEDKIIVNLRRLIAYFFLVAYGFFNGYQKVISFFIDNEAVDEYSLFFSISSVIFIALDRFTKALANDYKEFYNKKSNEL